MKQSFFDHFRELRVRLIKTALTFLVFFILGFVFSSKIITLISNDLIKDIDAKLVVSTPFEYFYSQIKIAALVGLLLSFPAIVYHIIKFIKPGLTKTETNVLKIFLPLVLGFFILGIITSYFLVVKVGLKVMSSFSATSNILNLWSLKEFITFVFYSSLVTALAFELPLIMFLLVKTNLISVERLRKMRKVAFIILLIFAAVFTPTTDGLTMLLLAVPLVVLYEVGIILTRMF